MNGEQPRALHLRVADRVERHVGAGPPAVGHPRLVGAGRTRAGSFTIAVTAEFVKYAHFIDQFQDAGSGEPWISYRHDLHGPGPHEPPLQHPGQHRHQGAGRPDLPERGDPDHGPTRFNNAGSATNLKQDSSAKDWPKLGPTPGIHCKRSDCSGFTRTFDFDPDRRRRPSTPIPFPSGNNPPDRQQRRCAWRWRCDGGFRCAGTVADAESGLVRRRAAGDRRRTNCAPGRPAGTSRAGSSSTAATCAISRSPTRTRGRSIVIYTASGRRTVIVEASAGGGSTVTRQCLKSGVPATAGACNSGGSGGT